MLKRLEAASKLTSDTESLIEDPFVPEAIYWFSTSSSPRVKSLHSNSTYCHLLLSQIYTDTSDPHFCLFMQLFERHSLNHLCEWVRKTASSIVPRYEFEHAERSFLPAKGSKTTENTKVWASRLGTPNSELSLRFNPEVVANSPFHKYTVCRQRLTHFLRILEIFKIPKFFGELCQNLQFLVKNIFGVTLMLNRYRVSTDLCL